MRRAEPHVGTGREDSSFCDGDWEIQQGSVVVEQGWDEGSAGVAWERWIAFGFRGTDGRAVSVEWKGEREQVSGEWEEDGSGRREEDTSGRPRGSNC